MIYRRGVPGLKPTWVKIINSTKIRTSLQPIPRNLGRTLRNVRNKIFLQKKKKKRKKKKEKEILLLKERVLPRSIVNVTDQKCKWNSGILSSRRLIIKQWYAKLINGRKIKMDIPVCLRRPSLINCIHFDSRACKAFFAREMHAWIYYYYYFFSDFCFFRFLSSSKNRFNSRMSKSYVSRKWKAMCKFVVHFSF